MNAKEMAELADNNTPDEVKKEFEYQDKLIREEAAEGKHSTIFRFLPDDDSGAKEHYQKLGFHFRPTGYVGGVWQATEDICW